MLCTNNMLLLVLVILLLIFFIRKEQITMFPESPVAIYSEYDDYPASTSEGATYNPSGPEILNGVAPSISYWNPYPSPLLESGLVRQPQLSGESSPY